MIRVVIADDHAIVREGLKRIINEFDGIEVVGETGNGAEVTGTCNDPESIRKVASEGDVRPFSIFDSIPGERPACLASSITVISSFRRKARTSRPIAASRVKSRVLETPCGF